MYYVYTHATTGNTLYFRALVSKISSRTTCADAIVLILI